MGHTATIINKAGQRLDDLDFHMADSLAHGFYILMKAKECDGGVSGKGITKNYSLQDLIEIKNRILNLSYSELIEIDHGMSYSELKTLLDKEGINEQDYLRVAINSQLGFIIGFVESAIKVAEIEDNVLIRYW